MNPYRLTLILAGAAATAAIAFGAVFADARHPVAAGGGTGWLEMLAPMLLTYAAGLGIGRAVLIRRG